MSRRIVPLLGLLALLLAACAAPAPAPAGEPEAGGPTRIGFGGLDAEKDAYQPVIDAFNAANPDVRVEFVPLEGLFAGDPSDMPRRLAEAADTFSSLLAGSEAAAAYLADLRPLMEADATFDRADLQPGALPEGALRVLPATLSVQTLSYDRGLWQAAGLAEPAPDWGWGDLLAAAEELTQGEGDAVRLHGLDDGQGGVLVLQGLLAEAGVSLAPAADGSLELDRPEVASAVARVAELLERGVLAAAPDGPAAPALAGGERRAAMWVGGAFGNAVMVSVDVGGGPAAQPEKPADEPADAALPPLPSDLAISRRGYSMSAGTAHPDAAWRWLSYLSARQISFGGGFRVMGAGYDVPARRSLAEASGFWEGLPAERAAALRAAIERAADMPPAADRAAVEALGAALADVAAGAPAEQAVARAAAGLAQALAERAAAPTPTPAAVQVQLPSAAVVPEGAARIRFSSFGPDLATIRELAGRFNAENTGVYVEVVTPSFGGEFSMAAMTDGLDCFTWPGPPAPEERAGLRDLQPLLDADSPAGDVAIGEDIPAALLELYRADGRLYGLPYAVSLRALNYNRGAFDAAGLEAPRADWELADLLEAARRLTDKEGADPRYGYSVEGDPASDLLAFLAWRGAAPFAGDGPARAARLTEPEVAQAIADYVALLRDYSPLTSLAGYRSDSGVAAGAFGLGQRGRVGMWHSSGLDMVVVSMGGGGQAAAPPDLAVAPPPLGGRPLGRADISASALMIAADSAQPEACWQWMEFLSRQAGGLGERFPARSSVATSDAYLQGARPGAAELYAAYAEALARPAPAESYAGVDPFWLLQAVDRALQGGDLERELEAAQAFSEKYLACMAAEDAPLVCAQRADPDYAGLGPIQE